MDAKGVIGIDGAQMSREILALKNAGKTEAEMWINSKGGVWADGVSIVGTMTNSGINFTTVNQGFADSVAGHLFQAGKKRVWMDYSLGLVHEVQGFGSTAILEAMNNSVATMLCGKTNKTADEVRAMMSDNTMMDADMALKYGFCDDVRKGHDILRFTNSSDALDAGSKQIKKLLPKNSKMEPINALLGLTNEASEAAQITAINAILKAKNEAETALATRTTELATATTALTETNGKLLIAENAVLTATNDSLKIKAAAFVELHRGKRIADTPENVTAMTNALVKDFDGTKAIIEAINLNVTAPVAPGNAGQRSKDAPIISVAEYNRR